MFMFIAKNVVKNPEIDTYGAVRKPHLPGLGTENLVKKWKTK